MSLKLTRTDLIRTQNFIGGHWRTRDPEALLAVTNPADDSYIAQVPDSNAIDARAAVDAAHSAFAAWRSTPAKQRAQLIKRWNALILEHQEDLAGSSHWSRASRWPRGGAKWSTPPATSSGLPKNRRARTAM